MNQEQHTSLPTIDTPYMIDFLTRLLNTPSPTGFSSQAIALVEKELAAFPEVRTEWTRKGSLLAFLPGENGPDAPTTRGLTAHVDTLGGMVREIKASGRLELTNVGGFAWGSVEGENCLVHTRENGSLRGSLLPHKASVHVYENVRDENAMLPAWKCASTRRSRRPMRFASLALKSATLSRLTPGLRLSTGSSNRATWTIKQPWLTC